MLPVNLNDLVPADIERLIESEVPESLTLDYKQELPTGQSESKREFLYDVVAMANSAGGDLIYGIAERRSEDDKPTGIPDRLLGIQLSNPQEEEIRLSSCIRDCVTPKLIGAIVQSIRTRSGDALVVRVPSGRSKPHMVTMGGIDRFYKRTGTVSHKMSWDEIRRAFSEQGELREAIARWRAHRVDLIEQKRGPIPLSSEVAMLFHIIPADAFTPGIFTDTWRLAEDEKRDVFVPNGNYYRRYNADGFLCHSSSTSVSTPRQKTDGYWSYTQLFRSGIVEYAFSHIYQHPIGFQNALILGQEVEQAIIHCYEDGIGRIQREGRTATVYVGFSMIGIEDKQIFSTPLAWDRQESGIRQNTFTSPEVLVDLTEQDERPYTRTLRPLVDTFWQLDGREGTPFIPNGEWKPFGIYR
jgi:Putative DNA-binding domain